jgi:cysteine synthase A
MARYENIPGNDRQYAAGQLNKLAPIGVNVYVKLGPLTMGSVKGPHGACHHRARRTERRLEAGANRHRSDQRQHRHRFGNGPAQKGYPLVVTMAESFSIERRKLLRFWAHASC